MGCFRENRLQVRLIGVLGVAACAAAGAALPPETISGDASRMLVTFLGLFSASLLPTITLLVNGMTSGGRSVQAIENLNRELEAALNALFLLFGCTAIAFAALMALSIKPPTLLSRIPLLTEQILPRMGVAIVVGSVTAIVSRAGQIPAILRRALAMRKDIAVEEARRKLTEKAPDTKTVRSTFTTHADFGKVVNIEDVSRETH